MKSALRILFILGLLASTSGCDEKGTCIMFADMEYGGLCTVNYSKDACESASGATYHKGDAKAGVAHCKAMGYTKLSTTGPGDPKSPSDAEEALTNGKTVTYNKPASVSPTP